MPEVGPQFGIHSRELAISYGSAFSRADHDGPFAQFRILRYPQRPISRGMRGKNVSIMYGSAFSELTMMTAPVGRRRAERSCQIFGVVLVVTQNRRALVTGQPRSELT